MRKKIYMTLYGYFPSDPRVKKEVKSLTKDQNNEIIILCLKQDEEIKLPRIKIVSLMPQITPDKRESITTLFLMKQNSNLILHCHDLTGLPPIIIPSIFRKIHKVIYDSHEFFPESARYELGWIYGIFFLILEKICSYFVDVIVGISSAQEELMVKRYNKPYILLPNYPSIEDIKSFYKDEPIVVNKNKFTIITHGAIRKNRCIPSLLDSLKIIEKEDKEIELIVIGDGPDFESVVRYAKKLKLTNAEFKGRLPFNETFQYLRESNLAVIVPVITFDTAMGCSNKIYECMAAGIPTISSDLKGSRAIMKEALMKTINPKDSQKMASTILEFKKDKELQQKAISIGKKLFEEKYHWELPVKKLLSFYKSLKIQY